MLVQGNRKIVTQAPAVDIATMMDQCVMEIWERWSMLEDRMKRKQCQGVCTLGRKVELET